MWEKEDKKRRALHSLGLTDAEIATICGVTQYTIRGWRTRRGLRGATNRYLSEAEHFRRLELYWQGYTDKAIGKKLGYSWTTIFHWRERNGLANSHRRDRIDSLCWECARAYAGECDWVSQGKKIWHKAKIPNNQQADFVVVECRHFELEGKEEAEMREELDKAKLDYKIACIEMDYADPEYRDAAILRYNATKERLDAVIREAKLRAKAERKGGGAA